MTKGLCIFFTKSNSVILKMADKRSVFLYLAGVNKAGEIIDKFTGRVKAEAEFTGEPVTIECLRTHLNNIKLDVADVSFWASLLRTYDIDPSVMKFYSELPVCDQDLLPFETELSPYDRQPRSSPLYFTLPEESCKLFLLIPPDMFKTPMPIIQPAHSRTAVKDCKCPDC
jgi:hypothetical protein